MTKPIAFGVIGGAWRAEFFFRIATLLPDRFRVCGCVAKSDETRTHVSREWGIRVFETIDELLEQKPEFVVISVPRAVCPSIILELAARRVAALAETPPAPDLDGLISLWNALPATAQVQVAEQYPFQPLHAARLAFVRAGKLGDVSQAQISVAHGYHGIALIRKFLNVGFENAQIEAFQFKSALIEGPNRKGPPTAENEIESIQTFATLRFGHKLGLFDFTSDQYFSWIRSNRVLIRGVRGEIVNTDARYLIDAWNPTTFRFDRHDAGETGNLEGFYHKGYAAGSTWWYRNPFATGRLSDDEIAIATCLESMGRYLETGEPFYSLADAAQDHYLSLLVDEAVNTGTTLESRNQIWSGLI
jgi:GFO/IDH/MocA oxidoreductase family protein